MSKFGGVDYMLVLQEPGDSASSKNIITESAIMHAAKGKIAPTRCFSTRKRETDARSPFDIRPFTAGAMFRYATPGCLSPVTMQDKLLIIAHANSTEVGPVGPRELASLLRGLGLHSVGLITFKACNVGKGTYLEDFPAAAGGIGLKIGWAKGYKGAAATILGDDGYYATEGDKFPTERIKADGKVLAGTDRYKIVRGPHNPFTAAVGRYT